VVRQEDCEVVRCPACSRTAPKDEAILAARSALIDVVMRDLTEDLRAIVRANPTLGYQPAQRYDWALRGFRQEG
jgi:ribosomal protein S26